VKNLIDQAIADGLEKINEEKYKLRLFEMELLVRIDSQYGVEETLQDIRSIGGVTVVTALDSLFRKDSGSYLSHIKIKFHPRSDSITPKTFVKDHLLPMIRGNEIPGCKVIRTVSQPVQIS
tara:strand:- start:804 stop:1166 length:363 start_codon:yes stop_codon:yes gene_type:complete